MAYFGSLAPTFGGQQQLDQDSPPDTSSLSPLLLDAIRQRIYGQPTAQDAAEAAAQRMRARYPNPSSPFGPQPGMARLGGAVQHFVEPMLELAAKPGEYAQRGYAGEVPSVEEMIPTGVNLASNMVGSGSPFARVGALGTSGGKLGSTPLWAWEHGEGIRPGGPGGAEGVAAPPREAAPPVPSQPATKLVGLPDKPIDFGEAGTYTPAPHPVAQQAARDYTAAAGIDYQPPKHYVPVDEPRAARIAQAYEEMAHDPQHPAVKRSYDALIDETNAQWEHIKKTGLKIDFIEPGMPDPYAKSPRLAQKDVHDNNHLWVFGTEGGFGSDPAMIANNPMLRPAGEINGRPVVANDIFRIVHDYFGHIKEGNGFRAAGEENAWRSHSAMYSPEARPAMTAETRGQNSWVNYGPHAAKNKTASGADTTYAPQKNGLLPDWVMEEGRLDPRVNPVEAARQQAVGRDPLMQEPVGAEPVIERPVQPAEEPEHFLAPAQQVDTSITDPWGYPVKGKSFSKAQARATKEMKLEPKGAGPMDLSGENIIQTPQFALERYVPPRGVPERMQAALQHPDVIKGVKESVEAGLKLGADKWYHTGAIHRSFLEVLGPEEGPKAFRQFMELNAAASPQSDVPTNIRNASFYYSIMRNRGVLPEKLPYPYGHKAQNLHRQNFEMLRQAEAGGLSADIPTGGWDIIKNPKPPSYSQALQGNLAAGAMDTHAYRNVVMRTGDPRFLATQVSEVIQKGREPSNFQRMFGEIKTNKKGVRIVTYRPRQLHEQGKMTMKEMQETPPFWESQPKQNEYGAIENFYRHLGRQYGLPLADVQAAAWAGGGKLTGLGTAADKTFQEMMNERVLYTAKVRGENPKDTLRWAIQGRKPLLTIGGAAALGAQAIKQQQDEQR